MQIQAVYPTLEHERAARAVVDFFSAQAETDAVILMGSCARGKAVRDSCLDFLILLQPEVFPLAKDAIAREWEEFYTSAETFRSLHQVGKYSHVDLDLIDGRFVPKPRGWTSGPDEFELEIGNTLVYAVPLWQRSDYLDSLNAQWLPYYPEALRQERLAMVRDFCINNLDHIPLFVARGLYFQSFNRLYDAFREFLQALFISRRTYPIAYDKWIREQVEEILGRPDLYQRLPGLLEISHFESDEIARKGEELRGLLEEL
jgi:predicted nucleotidyltransferase